MKKINITIEIPKDSKIKYEYNRETKEIIVDRILFGSHVYPLNYGFIKEALDWDGDELDALIIADQSFVPGSIVPVRILGAMEMIDDGETDTKLITVIDCDPRYQHLNDISDLSLHSLLEIEDFFNNYKNLQKKEVITGVFLPMKEALKEYNECVELMKKYKDIPKKEFIQNMKRDHPEKYPTKEEFFLRMKKNNVEKYPRKIIEIGK